MTLTSPSRKPDHRRRRTSRNSANRAALYIHRREAAKYLTRSDKQPKKTTSRRGEAEAPGARGAQRRGRPPTPTAGRRRASRNSADRAALCYYSREAAKFFSASDRQPAEATALRGEAEAPSRPRSAATRAATTTTAGRRRTSRDNADRAAVCYYSREAAKFFATGTPRPQAADPSQGRRGLGGGVWARARGGEFVCVKPVLGGGAIGGGRWPSGRVRSGWRVGACGGLRRRGSLRS